MITRRKEEEKKRKENQDAQKDRLRKKQEIATQNRQQQQLEALEKRTCSQHLDEEENQRYYTNAEYIPGKLQSCCADQKEMKKICSKCIRNLLNHHKPTCQKIQAGKCPSRRHTDYFKGIKSRIALDFQVNSVKVFSDRAHQTVESWLGQEFAVRGDPKQLDYCLRVLQMECFLRIFMDIKDCSYGEAEIKMANWK